MLGVPRFAVVWLKPPLQLTLFIFECLGFSLELAVLDGEGKASSLSRVENVLLSFSPGGALIAVRGATVRASVQACSSGGAACSPSTGATAEAAPSASPLPELAGLFGQFRLRCPGSLQVQHFPTPKELLPLPFFRPCPCHRPSFHLCRLPGANCFP